jgi:hypothetical protein
MAQAIRLLFVDLKQILIEGVLCGCGTPVARASKVCPETVRYLLEKETLLAIRGGLNSA